MRGVTPESGRVDHALYSKGKREGPKVEAITDYERLYVFENRYSVVSAYPETGRLHQIRRHFKHISHPLIGDVRYGKGKINRAYRAEWNLHRLALHAWQLLLVHPVTEEPLQLLAPLPTDLAVPPEALGFEITRPRAHMANR